MNAMHPMRDTRGFAFESTLSKVARVLTGQYGVDGLYVGVPVVIGAKGVERIVEIELDATERVLFDKSVNAVKTLVDVVKGLSV